MSIDRFFSDIDRLLDFIFENCGNPAQKKNSTVFINNHL